MRQGRFGILANMSVNSQYLFASRQEMEVKDEEIKKKDVTMKKQAFLENYVLFTIGKLAKLSVGLYSLTNIMVNTVKRH